MQHSVEIEDIEALRRVENIDDIELRNDIRELRPGNFIRLTILYGQRSAETLVVRITSIRGSAFRGKLVDAPSAPNQTGLEAGSAVTFTTAHIHSVAKGHTEHRGGRPARTSSEVVRKAPGHRNNGNARNEARGQKGDRH